MRPDALSWRDGVLLALGVVCVASALASAVAWFAFRGEP